MSRTLNQSNDPSDQLGRKEEERVEERLVRRLVDEKRDSVYLKRITKTVNVDGYLKDVEEEVLEEIAAAIRRTDNKVNYAMLRLLTYLLKAVPSPCCRRVLIDSQLILSVQDGVGRGGFGCRDRFR